MAVVGATTLALANGRLLPAATASASTGAAHVLIAARHCGKARGYYKVQARGVSCRRAREVLWHARSGQGSAHGFKCRTVGHGPGGGFPAKTTCRRGGAVASGWVVDNQVSRIGHASGTFSGASGPDAVRPGRKVRFGAQHLLPSRRVEVTIQPASCVGGNGCSVAARGGPWHTNRHGRVSTRFRFPSRYYDGCAAGSCASHPRFRRNSRAVVFLCVQGPTPDSAPSSAACARRAVTIR